MRVGGKNRTIKKIVLRIRTTLMYNLRPGRHNFLLPLKDDSLFITRMLYRKSVERNKRYT